MKSAVIVFPGSNCDRDVAVALEQATGKPPLLVWHKQSTFDDVDLIVLPGGFSYGDYLRCGAMAAHTSVMREVVARAKKGVPVLGICNGFQILTETGLLDGALMQNTSLKFVCKDVRLKVENTQTLFTSGYDSEHAITIPVAHMDGCYYTSPDHLKSLEDNDQIAFRYVDASGQPAEKANPNGSLANIAGIFNRNKTILGLMPHPERMTGKALGGEDGRYLFDGLATALAA